MASHCKGNIMNLAKIDLNLLKVFEQLYIERNVTSAAQNLGMAQSSLSSALKRLRELLGDELFVRSPIGMQPTQRAMEIEASISDCLNGARRAISSPKKFIPAESERIFVIGGSDFSAFTILPNLIQFLNKNAPHVRLQLRPFLPQEMISQIDSGVVDFAISSGKNFPKRINRKILFEEDMVVLAREDHPVLKDKSEITLEEYTQCQHVFVTSKGEGELIIDRELKKRTLSRDIYIKVQNFLIVPYIIENSDLISTLSERVAYQCSQRAKIKILPFPIELEKNDFNIIWGKTANSDLEIMWLVEEILNFFKDGDKPHA